MIKIGENEKEWICQMPMVMIRCFQFTDEEVKHDIQSPLKIILDDGATIIPRTWCKIAYELLRINNMVEFIDNQLITYIPIVKDIAWARKFKNELIYIEEAVADYWADYVMQTIVSLLFLKHLYKELLIKEMI